MSTLGKSSCSRPHLQKETPTTTTRACWQIHPLGESCCCCRFCFCHRRRRRRADKFWRRRIARCKQASALMCSCAADASRQVIGQLMEGAGNRTGRRLVVVAQSLPIETLSRRTSPAIQPPPPPGCLQLWPAGAERRPLCLLAASWTASEVKPTSQQPPLDSSRCAPVCCLQLGHAP